MNWNAASSRSRPRCDLGRSLGPLFASLAEWSVDLDKVEQARLDYDAKQR
ncbi:hypothetical protein [Nocardia sp. CA-120079]